MKPLTILPLAVLLFAFSAKTNAQPIYRLTKATVERTDLFQLVPQDFVIFYYTGNNGSAPEQQWLETAIKDENQYMHHLCKINADLKHDSALVYDNTGFKSGYYHVIDGNGDIIKHTKYQYYGFPALYKGIPGDSVTHTYTSGKIQQQTRGAKELRNWFYNTSGQVDSVQMNNADINQFPSWTGTQIFRYNSNNDIDTIINASEPLSNYMFRYGVYAYAAPGKLSSIVYIDEIFNPQGIDTLAWHQYTYNAANKAETILISFRDHATANMLPVQKQELTWDGDGRKTGETISEWDEQLLAWKYTKRYVYTYNSYNLPAAAEMQQWDNSSNSWMPWMRISLQYRLDWPTTVKEQVTAKQPIHIYPNPATDIVTIETGLGHTKVLTASITDMQGRVLKLWEVLAAATSSHTFSTKGFAPGNYILQLGDSKAQFTIVSH